MSAIMPNLEAQLTSISPLAPGPNPDLASPRAKPSAWDIPQPGAPAVEANETRRGLVDQEGNRSSPLNLAEPPLIDQLRSVLQRHNYTETGLRQALGQEDGRAFLRADLPLYLKRVETRCPLHTLAKLFSLHAPVTADEAREAFAPLTLEQLARLGLLTFGEGQVHARVALSLCDGLWLAHDFSDTHGQPMSADHVLGVSPATLTLARLAVKRPAELALDLGTGCGVQGLLVARQCRRVIAVDTNPRALNFARFNARLNDLDNLECRQGSLFEPVAGQRFDLIVCNPPYVISPESHYQFRDSGLPGDRICEQLVRAIPNYLNEGGFACLLCSWGHRRADPWSQRLEEWVGQNGCDALLFHGATQDPVSYAAAWTRSTDPATHRATLDEWCEYYRGLGLEALSVGAILLRRRAGGRHWLRKEGLPKSMTDSCSDEILRLVAAEDWLEHRSQPEELLAEAYQWADHIGFTQNWQSRHGRLEAESFSLGSRTGLKLQASVDAATAQLLAHCDARRPFGAIVAEWARARRADERQALSGAASLVRQLITCGFLVPAKGIGSAAPISPGGEPGTAAKNQQGAGLVPAEERKVSYE